MSLPRQCLDEFQHFLNMACHLDSSPFPSQYLLAVQHEGATLYPPDLFAVHVFHLDDIEQFAYGFIRIA
jgi:hypothetical protein